MTQLSQSKERIGTTNTVEEADETLISGEITQSPDELRRFLNEKYQITGITPITCIQALPENYELEGELVLYRRRSRSACRDRTETTVLGPPTLVLKPPPPLKRSTRSQGPVEELPHVMRTPLEYRRVIHRSDSIPPFSSSDLPPSFSPSVPPISSLSTNK